MAEPTYESIRPRTRTFGRIVVHLHECASTMDEARAWAEAGKEDGAVIAADRQTHGRGRSARAWFSPKGALLATLVIKEPAGLSLGLLPIAAGLALSTSIERLTKAPARIKWPNDVWLGGKKVAGVLTETRFVGPKPAWALVGIGVNVDVRAEDFPEELQPLATSLSIHRGEHVCAPALLKIWLEEFEALVDGLRQGDDARVVARAADRLVGVGRAFRATSAAGEVVGVLRGLSPEGALLLETDHGVQAIQQGDVELVRPL
jgi:BirA family transcriptional regulator, biotin operon repressor / biotin---[acetyl-CoA-carboxylase] ligase